MEAEDAAAITEALGRLRAADRGRREAIRDLKRLGYIRSLGLVGELGERIAASYYGVELKVASNPGYDLETRDGRRVQVKTLLVTPENLRASLGVLQDPYDVLLAIRMNEDYEPIEAIEVPRSVMLEHYPAGIRATWTKRLAADPRITRLTPEELATVGAGAELHGASG